MYNIKSSQPQLYLKRAIFNIVKAPKTDNLEHCRILVIMQMLPGKFNIGGSKTIYWMITKMSGKYYFDLKASCIFSTNYTRLLI